MSVNEISFGNALRAWHNFADPRTELRFIDIVVFNENSI